MGPLAFGLGVVLGFVGSIPAAGPLLLLVVASGLEGRPRRALALASGGALAESLYVALAFWGFAGLLTRHASLLLTLRIASVLLLLGLGAWLLRKRTPSNDTSPSAGAQGFVTGLLLVGLNPAFLATWSAVAAVTYSNGWLAADARRVPWLAGGSFVGVVLWFACIAALSARYRERFQREVLERVVRGLGVVLIACALWMAISAFTSFQ